MIRYDHRNFDVQGTERVYKKVVHSGQNSIPLVDKDGIPMRGPNIASLTRLQSSYTVSPRGVPTKKSSHAYSGQLANAKLKNLVNDLNTSTSPPELISSYSNMQNYSQSFHGFPNGLSSAGSSRHYKSGVNSPKKRSLSTRQSQSVKSMAKSASSLRSIRPSTVSVPDQLSSDLEKLNESAQGKRLEKEWTNLTQCRALKRSSEIVSHRVDRMYFMTGNKLSLQSKYHVEDCELEQLRELQQARASSRSSRSSRSRKGDIYRPDRLTQTSMEELEEGLDEEHVVITTKRSGMLHGNDRRFKENKDPHVMVSQKILTPKPNGTTVNNRKSPLLGWAGGDMDKDSTVTNTIISQDVAHRDAALNEERIANGNDGAESPGVEDEGEDYPDAITEQKAGNGELDAADGQTNGHHNGHTAQAVDHSEEVVEADAKHTIENRSNDSTNGDKTSSQEVDNDNGKGSCKWTRYCKW